LAVSEQDLSDEQLLRYSRHILLDDIGIEGQRRIVNSRVLIIGAGGLGSPAAMYLACAGVGQITLVDDDHVDLTNLQRQIMHSTARVGQSKVASAQNSLEQLNPEVQVHTIAQRADAALLDRLIVTADVVLDCCDNFTTRQAINAACFTHRKPLVSGAAITMDGQISVYDPRRSDAPCYACAFPPEHPPQETRCATMGVLAPLVGVIGSMQAAEALKLIVGNGISLAGWLLMLDARNMEWTRLRLQKRSACSVCGTAP
jgi:molybdopterin/thiamine biosynthesis adenylyltransferase